MDSISTIFFGRHTDTLHGKHDPYADAFDAAHRNMLQFLFGNIHMVRSSLLIKDGDISLYIVLLFYSLNPYSI